MKPIPFTRFCSDVLGVVLTPAQRVLASVAFDGVEPQAFDGEERDLAAALFGPVDIIPQEARSVLVGVIGGRSGKTFVFEALYSLWRMLVADVSTLARGEQATALIVAPDVRLARQPLRYALGAAKAAASIARLIDGETSDSFTIARPDGARVALEVLPATRGGSALRGRSLVSAVLSEPSFFRDESAAVADQDVFRAVTPRVLPGGMVVVVGTPWIEAGLLYVEHTANFGAPTRAIAAHAPTSLMRPDPRTASIIARERAINPDNAAREFDAEFMCAGSGLFFPPSLLSMALDRELAISISCPPGVKAIVGGDIGLVRDASAFVAVHVRGTEVTVAEVLELRPQKGKPLKLSAVVAEACAFAGRHGVRDLNVDHHALAPAREHLPAGFRLSPVDPSQAEKLKRFEGTRAAMGEGRVRIPGALVRIVNQLGDTIARPTPGGGLTIAQPRRGGVHGDLAAAFVLAVAAAVRKHRNALIEALRSVSIIDTLRDEQRARDDAGYYV